VLTGLVVLAVGGLAIGSAVLIWHAMQQGTEKADQLASVLSLILAVGVAVTGLVAWEWRRRAARRALPSSDEVAAATQTLAEVVLAQWRHEARLRGLEDPAPMPVRWRLASARAMDHPEVIAPDGLSFEGRGDDIAQLVAAFRALPRRRLVVIGGPGVGKTTLAVQIVVQLLTDRRDDEPVAVMFSLIDFDPAVSSPREWLVARLQRDYPGLTEPLAAALVERGRILPVLDGLDEVPDDRQASILRTLNTAAEGVDGFILTSRRQAYLRALSESGDVLTAAAVIAPLALTPADARRYLQAQLAPHDRLLDPVRHAAWTDVLTRLDDGRAPDLATVVGNPLGLWLIRTVYVVGRRDPAPLIASDHPDRAGRPLRDHLLDQLIPAVVQAEAARGPGSASTTAVEAWCRYLTTIATQLRDGGSRDWLWWRLAPNLFHRRWTRLAGGLLLGVVASGPCVVLVVISQAIGMYLSEVLPAVVVICMIAGLLLFRPARTPRRVNLTVRGRVLALLGHLFGGLLLAVAGLVVFIMLAVVGEPFRDAAPLLYLAAYTTPPVVFCAVVAGFFSDDGAVRSTSPSASCRSDALRVGVLLPVVALAIVPIMLPAVVDGDADYLYEVMVLSILCLLAGTLYGLAAGPAQTAFRLAVALLASQRLLPFCLMRFLDHAHRLGLLRVVGAAYQFRHAELQDHLAPRA
jgi:hypothetical protein